MKNIITTETTAHLDDLCFGYWEAGEDEDGRWVRLTDELNSDHYAAARYLGCSHKLIGALVMFSDSIKEDVGRDQLDIWERLNDLEAQVRLLHIKLS